MLKLLWLVLSMMIAFGELLAAAQPEWIVHRTGMLVQGLFTICNPERCRMRIPSDPVGALIPLCQISGTLLLGFSALAASSALTMCNRTRHIQHAVLEGIVKAQCTAVLLLQLSVCAVPFDMSDVNCTVPLLLQSSECRVGWAYALHCIAAMLSISCPVLAKIVSEQCKRYKPLITEQYI